MLRQLPRWAWIGGGLLAFIAGMINAVGFMAWWLGRAERRGA